MSSYYKQQLNDWIANLDVKASKVLDIGGAQDPVKGRTKSWEVRNYKIADLPDPHHEKQKADILIDLNQPYMGNFGKKKQDLYNVIFCLEVFDYIWNPAVAFYNIKQLLKVNGIAWVSFPFVYPIHNPVEDDALRYTEPAIRRLAKATDLKVKEIIYRRPKPDNPYLLQFYSADGMRSAPDIDHNVTGYIVKLEK